MASTEVMGPLGALLIYLATIFVGGAALAPFLYKIVQAVAPHSEFAQTLLGEPFHRYVNRCFLFIALAGLWPFLRSLGIRTWSESGLRWEATSRKSFGVGLALGLGSLALIALPELVAGARAWNWDRSAASVRDHLVNAVLAAALAGFVEETLFRAGIFGALRRTHTLATAFIVSSLLYALLHFFEKPASPTEVTAISGFVVLGQMLKGFIVIERFLPMFFNLTFAGLILARAFHLSGSIWLPFGIHAGWIFWLKTFGFFTIPVGASSLFWGSGKLIDGWAAFFLLGAMSFLLFRRRGKLAFQDGGHGAPTEKLA